MEGLQVLAPGILFFSIMGSYFAAAYLGSLKSNLLDSYRLYKSKKEFRIDKPDFGFSFLFNALFVFLIIPSANKNEEFYEIDAVKEVLNDIRSTRQTLLILMLTSILSVIITVYIESLN